MKKVWSTKINILQSVYPSTARSVRKGKELIIYYPCIAYSSKQPWLIKIFFILIEIEIFIVVKKLAVSRDFT